MPPLVLHRTPTVERSLIELDAQVALRLDGFRWVRWVDGQSPDAPRDSEGRFLARRENPLAHVQVSAPSSMPLAPQPYRHVPRYSLDVGLALEICAQVGLFREDGAVLRRDEHGTWSVDLTGLDDSLRDVSLARLLVRAALRWPMHRSAAGKGSR